MSLLDLPETMAPAFPKKGASRATHCDADQPRLEAQTGIVGVTPLASDHRERASQQANVGGNHRDADHDEREAHSVSVGVTPLAPGHVHGATHAKRAGGGTTVKATTIPRSGNQFPNVVALTEYDLALGLAAATLDDIERTRIALGNRLYAMKEDGLAATPQYAMFQSIADGMDALDREATRALERAMRKHPLGPWVKAHVGVGEKQAARLLAAIGDPYVKAEQEDADTREVIEDARPRRGPAELWAYCGYAPGQKRRRGVKANWNAQAKTRAFLIAESCIKQTGETDSKGRPRSRSPYRDVYDTAKAKWADRDTTDGHKHNHALRCVAKAVLKDLYLASRELHQENLGSAAA